MSAPVQGGPAGPLGYAPSQARQAGTAGASTASPLQELQDKLSQIVTSLRDDRDPGASPGMPSSRDALPSHSDTSLRDVLSSRDGLAAQDSLLSRDTPPPRSLQSLRHSLLSLDVLPSRDSPPLWPTLFPHDGLHSSETTSLRDIPLSPDPVLPPPPAPPSKGHLISSVGPRSLPDDAGDPGLAPPKGTISRWQAGPSRASGTGSASAACAAWKRTKRSPQVFKGGAALKDVWSGPAVAPAVQTAEPPLALEKRSILASTARLRVVVLAAGGALGLLWATPANRQAGEEAALVSLRDTPRPAAARNLAAERAPDPSAAAKRAAGAALYQDFLKWRQLQLPGE